MRADRTRSVMSRGFSGWAGEMACPDERRGPVRMVRPGDRAALPMLDRSRLQAWQLSRFQQLWSVVRSQNRFWSERWSDLDLPPEHRLSWDEFRRLPFTTKSDLLADQQQSPPYGRKLTYPVESYTRLHQTSGTTGTPLRWLDTADSWRWVLHCWSQLFAIFDLQPADRLFFPFSFGPFLGFWAGFEGANALGNLCLAGGGMSSVARLQFLQENEVTVVCCTPTYALRLAEVAAETGFPLQNTSVRKILVAGEPGGQIAAVREQIEQAWGARLIDHWGMTELGPLAMEPADDPYGLHLLETECIAEVLDPATGEPVPMGEEGELVITNLGRIGNPLIRYRTGDRVRAEVASRMQPVIAGDPERPDDQAAWQWMQAPLLRLPQGILGRTDDMLTIRGNNLYPASLEEIIRQFAEVGEYRIEVRTEKGMQAIWIEIEPRSAGVPETALQSVADQLAQRIKDRWHFTAAVSALPVGTLPRSEMKSRRFFRRDA